MPNDKLSSIHQNRLGDTSPHDDQLGSAVEQRLDSVQSINGVIRWDRSTGMPDGPLEQAFGIHVESLEVKDPGNPRSNPTPQPYDCTVRFWDASDQTGPAVRYVVLGLKLLGLDTWVLDDNGHNLNGGFILTPFVKTTWDEPLGGRLATNPLQFTPEKRGTPLTKDNAVVTIDFELAPRY